ncbi:uncharacterized protein LY89DRAFT_660287, partial [Mollisia scopiformis]
LFKAWPELLLDVDDATSTDWNGSYPWDDENRPRYVEEELSLNQAWETQILASRDLNSIKIAAKNNCFRSIVELDHLRRRK